ncbi:hypothetical protein J4458_04525 [Candidatus Woesearchaeota archaeon]|nr:hypothetical protein [Candidatus Woesearchaeota archaeon]
MPKDILTFRETKKNDIKTVGGKAVNLGILFNSGFNVPDGFTATTKAYYGFLDENKLNKKIGSIIMGINCKNTKNLDANSKKIRDLILKGKINKNLIKEIEDQLKKIKADNFAVRSSATAEDLPKASFAGQQDTYLFIKKNKIVEHIRKCWASLYTSRAIFYRKEKNIGQGSKLREKGTKIFSPVSKKLGYDKLSIIFLPGLGKYPFDADDIEKHSGIKTIRVDSRDPEVIHNSLMLAAEKTGICPIVIGYSDGEKYFFNYLKEFGDNNIVSAFYGIGSDKGKVEELMDPKRVFYINGEKDNLAPAYDKLLLRYGEGYGGRTKRPVFKVPGATHVSLVKNSLDISFIKGIIKETLEIMHFNLFGIAVVVQEMIKPDFAGVMFTVDPIYKKDILVEATLGIGEKLVSGKVTPNSYFIGRKNFEIKNRQVTEDIDEGIIVKIAKIGAKIEKLYKKPQDIEFAVKNKEIFILQSRAITTL